MSGLILPVGCSLNPEASGWRRVVNPYAPASATTYVHNEPPLLAIRSRDLGRWHLSVSRADRIPTWGELGFARDELLPPDTWLMVPFPPRSFWINYNPRVLHLWEFRDEELIKQFQWEGSEARRHGFSTPDSGEPE